MRGRLNAGIWRGRASTGFLHAAHKLVDRVPGLRNDQMHGTGDMIKSLVQWHVHFKRLLEGLLESLQGLSGSYCDIRSMLGLMPGWPHASAWLEAIVRKEQI